jgi:hypothetical protein
MDFDEDIRGKDSKCAERKGEIHIAMSAMQASLETP